MRDATVAPSTAGRVGPNAIIRTAEALVADGGQELARAVFTATGIAGLLDDPPASMVDERMVAMLNATLLRMLAPDRARAILADAGRRTGNYVLENRIPAAARLVMATLPSRLSARLLLSAIARNGWTFAGSGRVLVYPGHPSTIAIVCNPIATPGCPWHTAAFRHLFRSLVSPAANALHAMQIVDGERTDRFTIDW